MTLLKNCLFQLHIPGNSWLASLCVVEHLDRALRPHQLLRIVHSRVHRLVQPAHNVKAEGRGMHLRCRHGWPSSIAVYRLIKISQVGDMQVPLHAIRNCNVCALKLGMPQPDPRCNVCCVGMRAPGLALRNHHDTFYDDRCVRRLEQIMP
jgi:hypothetical protein